jgi:[acyl-carrier-protein] S-malonyltransferase
LSKIMTGDKGDELQRTVHTQPAVLVHSIALLEALRADVPLAPIIAAGHSLGEYSALVAAGVLSFDDALDVVKIRASGMDEAQPAGTCGMAAVVGLDQEEARILVETHRLEDVLEAANFNAPDQTVISGHLSAVNRVLAAVKGKKRTRAVLLPVSSAFHTQLMAPAQGPLKDRLASIDLQEPAFPVVANVNAAPYPTGQDGKQILVDQIVNPVRWSDCIGTMTKAGATTFVEIGPGKVLAGLLRRIDRKAMGINVSSLDGIESLGGASA